MEHHAGKLLGVPQMFPRGYLAVDFFFALSGFVLSYAYQQKLDHGLPGSVFLKSRLIRLYPLYFLGFLLGLIRDADRIRRGVEHASSGGFVSLVILGLLMLPSIALHSSPGLVSFPFDFPAWSLFQELFANVAHSLFLRRRGFIFLVVVSVVSGVLLIVVALRGQGVNVGTVRSETVLAIPRVIFSYSLGMLTFRAWSYRKLTSRVHPMIPVVLLLGVMALPLGEHTTLFDMIAICCVFPALVVLGAASKLSQRMTGTAQLLGQTSYAVYLIHAPLAVFVVPLWARVFRSSFAQDAPWSVLIYSLLVFLAALLLDFAYDTPVRKFLRHRFADRTEMHSFTA